MNKSPRHLELVGAAARYPALRNLAESGVPAEKLNRQFGLDLRERESLVVAQLSDDEIAEYRQLDERRFEGVIPYGV